MSATFHNILLNKIIPVLVIDDPSNAKSVGEALVANALPIVEITLRTPTSWQSVIELQKVQGLTVGIGSVRSKDDLQRAADSGVSFAVSPGIQAHLVEHAQKLQISYLPGVATPSEIMLGVSLGLEVLKFFPAETLGGVAAIKAMSAPFPALKFIPTGGITTKNATNYLAEKNIPAVGGSWMVSREKIAARDFDSIANDISASVQLIRDLE
jgi:2-dehydro-3-deoxyphosphogluconate aldolase/(4S)-4-hydroxy-2-oxoglutarate aldolase